MHIDAQYVKDTLPHRCPDAHKGSCGTVLSVCGSDGMMGAAYFAAEAALRCGAGLVKAVVPRDLYPILCTLIPEAVSIPPEQALSALAGADAAVIGCGWGQGQHQTSLLPLLLQNARCPVILDADGINIACAHIDILQHLSENCVLTPHPGEMARLLQCSSAQVQADRPAAALKAAQMTGSVVVLKGHGTLVAAPDGRLAYNPTGNHGMATGGMGDVLAGMIASLAAQGLAPWDAACCGVYLHGLAADRAAVHRSMRALLPRDLLQVLPSIFAQWEQREE